MARFCLKHLLALTITLVVVSFLVFTLNEFSPGDVARKILGAYATQEQVALLTKEMGLDRPVVVRYVEYVGKLAAGDLGFSTRFKVPVREIIWDRLRNTLVLAAVAFALIVPVSMLLGVLAGMREGSGLDRGDPRLQHGRRVGAGVRDGRVPGEHLRRVARLAAGHGDARRRGGWSVASQFVLPVAVIVLYDAGYVVSMIRASMVEVMQRPYIRTAVLKGMAFRQVVTGHALRNAMINPVTVICLQISYLISGVVVVETVFAYPGFGRMMLEAALFKDIALIEVGALVAVGVAILTQVLADLAYMLLDPRIRT